MLGVLYTMLVWWRDVIHEGQEGDHTPVVQLGLRYGMILFIASEVMFFVAWFWAFFNASLNLDAGVEIVKDAFTGGVWPPKGIEVFDPWHLPLLNTLILLTSGTTVTWAHHALLHNDRKGLVWGLVLTIVLGLIFTSVQAYEYAHAPFSFAGNIYGATFFMATGFHGFHVIVGTIFLIVCLIRAVNGHFTPEAAFRLRGGGLVLALRRRGLALPVLQHLHLGRLGRADRRPLRHGAAPVDKALYPDLPPSQTGMRGRCPRCGEGRLFKGFLGLAGSLPGLRPRLRFRRFRRRPGGLHHHDRRLHRRRPGALRGVHASARRSGSTSSSGCRWCSSWRSASSARSRA